MDSETCKLTTTATHPPPPFLRLSPVRPQFGVSVESRPVLLPKVLRGGFPTLYRGDLRFEVSENNQELNNNPGLHEVLRFFSPCVVPDLGRPDPGETKEDNRGRILVDGGTDDNICARES